MVHALEVAGSFDDCQRLVKRALADPELVAAARLCPANSINLGRLLPPPCQLRDAVQRHGRGRPSNFERIRARWNNDPAALHAWLRGCAVSDAETLATIRQVYEDDGRLVDPHTAVGIAAARRLRAATAPGGEHAPIVVLATADAGKFPETVRRATGVTPPVPAPLQELLERPKQATPLAPRFLELRAFILERSPAAPAADEARRPG